MAGIVAVPLRIGSIRVGVLLAHREAPAPAARDRGVLTDLLAFAHAATDALLGLAASGSDPHWMSERTSGYRAEVHHASPYLPRCDARPQVIAERQP
jgi:hypothetical protein